MSAVLERVEVTPERREPIETVIKRLRADAERTVTARPRLKFRQLLHLIRVAYAGHPQRKVRL
jgi:hypothetical protein